MSNPLNEPEPSGPEPTPEPLPYPAYPYPAPRPIGRPNFWLHGALFLGSIVSTTLIGGPLYGASIMAILLAHEMGHYLVARHYRVPASLPYFIPMPISIFGTMGAVIRMASLGADRRVLFDIGVAGPLAGLVLAIPACLIGLSMSHVVQISTMGPGQINLGSSILFQWFSDLFFGKLPEGYDITLHPIAFAGWAGLFVTALNLLPIGQLDGGHVIYALLGRRSKWVSGAVAVGFAAMAVFVNLQWLFLAALLFLFGIRHPPTADDTVPIDGKRRVLGILLMIFLILSFTPKPFTS
jgi:membrane-associated protease RseP (regulator of RpoE activity)